MKFNLNPFRFVRDWLTAMGLKKTERQELREEKKEVFALDTIAVDAHFIREELHCICEQLKRLNEFLRAAKSFEIKQGGSLAITGIVLGATGTFTETPTPAGGALQAGNIPAWTSDDPNTSLTPSADGSSVNVATSATDTATSFNLTVSGVNSAGVAISSSVNVPLLPAAAVPATGFTINQTA